MQKDIAGYNWNFMATYSKDELFDFCLRQLGAPVIEINLAEEQLDDCWDIALSYYWEFHADGLERSYHQQTLTQTNIDNKFIVLPDEIISVVKLFPFDAGFRKNSIQYQAFITDILDHARSGGISNYLINSQYYNTINELLNREKSISFNKNSNKLMIYTDWSALEVGDILLLECFKIIDPEDYPSIYNDKWIKQYLTQLFKKQWGSNLKKYTGVQLPGGVTLDGQIIYTEADTELRRLEEVLRNEYELPVMGYLG